MKLLPELNGFQQSGEKQEKTAIFFCVNCQSRRTVKAGKTIPKCSKCDNYTYWIKATEL